MAALVSILIPAYNAASYIADTIRSAQAQTWPNVEIIIVDDGSKDQTLAVAREFAGKNIKVISQKNQGAATTRNHAYAQAQGEYIQWLDADDLLSADKVERQMRVMLAANDSRLLTCCPWGAFLYRPSRAHFAPTPLGQDLSPLEWQVRKWESNAHMQTATWLVSRALSEAAGPWDQRLTMDDDGEYFFRVVRAASHIRFVPEAKVYYRVTGGARLSYIGRSDKKKDSQFLSMNLQMGYMWDWEDSPRTRAAAVIYLQTWLIHFYPERPDLVAKSREIARQLGGNLHDPTLGWKYGWIQKLFGWPAAKNVQEFYNLRKESVYRLWDYTCSRIGTNGAP